MLGEKRSAPWGQHQPSLWTTPVSKSAGPYAHVSPSFRNIMEQNKRLKLNSDEGSQVQTKSSWLLARFVCGPYFISIFYRLQ
jgi:hypothetical protein